MTENNVVLMNQTYSSIEKGSLDAVKNKIYSADLSEVEERLVKVDKWPEKQAKEIIAQYRNFLFLKAKYGVDSQLPPSYEIDEAWHAHVLHTKSYMKFCNDIYGEYLHHNPHIVSAGDNPALLDAWFENTQELYLKEFGSYIYSVRLGPLKKIIKGFRLILS